MQGAHASDETNREIVRVYSDFFIEQKDYASAIRQLTEHLGVDPEDGGAWHLLGIGYLLSGDAQKAVPAFEKAATRVPPGNKGIVLYYQADALNRMGDTAGAERLLQAARAEPVSSWSAGKALDHLAPKTPLTEIVPSYPGRWSSQAWMGGGYDSNVLLAPANQLATLAATNAGSPTLLFGDATRYSKQGFHGDTIDIEGRGSFDWHTASAASTFNSLNLGASLDWGKVGGLKYLGMTHYFGDDFNLSLLNTSGLAFYSWDDTIRWRGQLQHGFGVDTDFIVPVRYQNFAVPAGASSDDDRSGVAVGIQAHHRRQARTHLWSIGLKAEKLFASGRNFRSWTFNVPLGWQAPLPWWALGLRINAIPGLVLYPESTTGRRDFNLTAMASLARRFGSRLGGSIDYLVMTNPSSVEVATYNRQSVFAKVTYDLL